MRKEHSSSSLCVGTTLVLLIAGCAPDSGAPKASTQVVETGPEHPDPFPEMDLRSPDTVVKSHWLVQDWMERNGWRMISSWKIDPELQKYFDASIAMSAGERLSDIQGDYDDFRKMGKDNWRESPPTYQRDIVEIKNESDTRAIVLAKIKNVTPIPNDRKLDEFNQERRDYGLDVRYVVEQTKEGWRLAQAWKRDSSSMKLAEVSDGRSDAWSRVWQARAAPKGPGTPPDDWHFSQTSP